MRKKIAAILCCLLAMVLFAGCSDSGGSYSAENDDISMEESADGFGGAEEYAKEEGESGSKEAVDDQKLVYEASMVIQTKKYDKTMEEIYSAVSKQNGYVEDVQYHSIDDKKNCTLVARIPSESYRQFLTSVKDTGNVKDLSETVEDVTSNYIDVNARLKSLNTKMDKLEKLKEKAEDLDQLLKIEDQISDVQYEIENYTSQLKYLEKRIAYSTVTIDIDEIITYSEADHVTFFEKFVDANINSIKRFIKFLQGMVLSLVYLWPYLILIGILIFFLSKRKKKRASKK